MVRFYFFPEKTQNKHPFFNDPNEVIFETEATGVISGNRTIVIFPYETH